MKVFALASALLATVAYAAPAPVEVLITVIGAAQTPIEIRKPEILVTFIGAADASFTQYFSIDGSIEYIRT